MKKNIVMIIVLTFTAVLFAQKKKFPMGILPEEDKLYETLPQKTVLTRSFYEGSPQRVSLKKYAPYPGDQSPYGTCTGWAVAYAARTIIASQRHNWTNRQEITNNAFSPIFQYRVVEPTRNNCNGAQNSSMIESLKDVGSVLKKDFKSFVGGYTACPVDEVPSRYINKAKKYRIEEYTTLWSVNDYNDSPEKITRAKASLAAGNPVIISMICPKSFFEVSSSGLWKPWESPLESTDGMMHGRHAMTVVGYDNSKFGGAFEVQNSWGENWGKRGYVWIRYNDFRRFVYQAFEIVQLPKPKLREAYLSGSFRLYDLDDKINLPISLEATTRNWNVSGPGKKGDNVTYKVKHGLLTGSKMKMYFKSESPCFLYILGTGSVDKSVANLFPVDGISSAMNYKGGEVALPAEDPDYYYQSDKTAGKDYLIIICSKEKLDIESIKRKISFQRGTVSTRVSNVLGNILIKSKYVTFDKNRVAFSVKQHNSNKKSIAFIIESRNVARK